MQRKVIRPRTCPCSIICCRFCIRAVVTVTAAADDSLHYTLQNPKQIIKSPSIPAASSLPLLLSVWLHKHTTPLPTCSNGRLGQTPASRRIHQAATARNDRCSLCPKEEKNGSPNPPLLGQARAGGVAAAATATTGCGFIRWRQNTAQKFAIV